MNANAGSEQGANAPVDEVEAIVVGGGLSGIRTAIALKQQGLDKIVILERGSELGGVWHQNRYPGVGCDVPSPAYSYGLQPANWSRLFARGNEIRGYLQQVAADYDIVKDVRLNTELLDAAWDDVTRRWVCTTTVGEFRARFLVLATGVFETKTVPTIPGADRFTGEMFHSTDWPADFDPTGKRIAVVGTGASAIQIVPQIQPKVDRLVLLQRTPAWIVPKPDLVHAQVGSRRALFRQRFLRAVLLGISEALVVTTMKPQYAFLLERAARWHLRKSVADPELRAKLTPDYAVGCKRMLLSSEFYPAVAAENVDFVDSGMAEIRDNSVITSDGREFKADTIVFATGFAFGQQVLQRVRGRDGRVLAEKFAGTPRTYRGTTMAGCPNAFMVAGANSGSASVPLTAEAQSRYIASAIATMREQGIETVEVRQEAEDDWNRYKDAKLAGSVWNAGGCTSFYVNDDGINTAAWPGSMRNQVKTLRRFDVENYTLTYAADRSGAESSVAVVR
ncbi:flavin-containing monooxygenase [Nocardia sp. NPDC059240]|uniref:flavin-containing monooxygenase n=1 Tax=Nocardia sp. NPDC059240 TaxID=3346786 RepID=UPI0036B4C2BB